MVEPHHMWKEEHEHQVRLGVHHFLISSQLHQSTLAYP